MKHLFETFTGRLGSKAGKHDVDSATMWTTPWQWRSDDGIYIGHDKTCWVYRELPLASLKWEDGDTRLGECDRLEGIVNELGNMRADTSLGIKTLADEREIHVLAVRWEARATAAAGVTDELAAFQNEALQGFVAPQKAVLVGVKVKDNSLSLSKGAKGLMRDLFNTGAAALGESAPSLARFEDDLARVTEVLGRFDCTAPRPEARRQLEAWYSEGRTTDALIQVESDCMLVGPGREDLYLQMSAVHGFGNWRLDAPDNMWALDLAVGAGVGDVPHVISVRAGIQGPKVARTRARRNLRRRRTQIDEQSMTGDIDRVEDQVDYERAESLEQFIATGQKPFLTRCSIVFATAPNAERNFTDALEARYGIEVRPLELRQLEALEETLPCSQVRSHPHLHDVTVPMLSHAGLQAWSHLGDTSGAFCGLDATDLTPVFLDPAGAPAKNKPASMLVAGSSGSGKTFLLSLLATQSTLGGHRTIFINPKAGDDLSSLAEYVGGQVVNMNELEASPEGAGFLDPFGWAQTPALAATYAKNFIVANLGRAMTPEQSIELGAGLMKAAHAGKQCTWDALAYVDDRRIRDNVAKLCSSRPLFHLGISKKPRSLQAARDGFTLIQWNRKLDLPGAGKPAGSYSDAENEALAALRLTFAASTEMLHGAGGGTIIFDEAWSLLQNREGLDLLQQLGREGRSQNILPILATQRVDDVIKDGVNMEDLISRVFVMKLGEEKEARAALELAGLEPTAERIAELSNFGPQQLSDGGPVMPARAIHRDLDGRHAALFIGPVPREAIRAYDTNPTTRGA
ncbi:MAG: hypothetical protein GY882_11570 [Actinomycetia bacterium]|nr:hypothetical protein [Actinomycetes bacterium]